jgi:site-specific DNA recombinase
MKEYFAYTRVSTLKQGQKGVSLQEQRSAIELYASRKQIHISRWFEERQTAAIRGRPIFGDMIKKLRRNRAAGVILHRVDRGTRNFRDWADLGELGDQDVEVHIASDDLDLSSRSGRLSADIQVVIAADYIRNLREETRKGFYGRLKQGLYPLPAPIGYLNKGSGKAKAPDPKRAPLVAEAFGLYASGDYSIKTLRAAMTGRGLVGASGKPLSISMIGRMLNNPFYVGIIRITTTGETFQGKHAPLISPVLYAQVQDILKGKSGPKLRRHQFPYRRLLRCGKCQRHLIGELQKGHVYYRCRNPHCTRQCVRQALITEQLQEVLLRIRLSREEAQELVTAYENIADDQGVTEDENRKAIDLRIRQAEHRLERLTDLLLDETITEEAFRKRQERLLLQIAQAEQDREQIGSKPAQNRDLFHQMCELAQGPQLRQFSANDLETRDLLKETCANFWVNEKKLSVELHFAYDLLAKRTSIPTGDPIRGIMRTLAWKFARGPDDCRQEENHGVPATD